MGSDGPILGITQMKGITTMNDNTDRMGNTLLVGTDGKPLSDQQNVVYHMHKSGMSNVTIAGQLNIAPGTVSNALVNARKRMGEWNAPTSGDMDVPTFMAHRYTKLVDTVAHARIAITQALDEIEQLGALAQATGVVVDGLMDDIAPQVAVRIDAILAIDAPIDGDTVDDPSNDNDDTDGAVDA